MRLDSQVPWLNVSFLKPLTVEAAEDTVHEDTSDPVADRVRGIVATSDCHSSMFSLVSDMHGTIGFGGRTLRVGSRGGISMSITSARSLASSCISNSPSP